MPRRPLQPAYEDYWRGPQTPQALSAELRNLRTPTASPRVGAQPPHTARRVLQRNAIKVFIGFEGVSPHELTQQAAARAA
jgi:hypothetical protein